MSATPDLATLIARARTWAEEDPDPATRAELEALLASEDVAKTDLVDRFATSLEFGTAGLRGVIGAGPNRMNRAVVIRTTWGLGHCLLDSEKQADPSKLSVVVGFDGRRMSREFATDVACVLAAMGIRSHVFEEVGPTPFLAFVTKYLRASAGVMITASHNPPEYNGYKAYWGNGAQIIPPTDELIAHAIEKAPAPKSVPYLSFDEAKARGLVTLVGRDLEETYLDEVKKLSLRSDGDHDLAIVYTALHGVGDRFARKALAQTGFSRVTSVPQQQNPDGAFPTVAFPNPEEKGAMDLSFALARETQADLILANDPDADRLAVAVPSPRGKDGYVQLTGNQVGVLLGHYVLTSGLTNLDAADASHGTPLALASIVSSPMLGVIAHKLGARYEEVLTGFKWIANRAMDLEAQGDTRFVFGYEEALGYTVGDLVRDKDGISAAALFAELASVLRARRTTVVAHLEGLYRRYGLFVSSQVNLTRKGVEGAAELRALMTKLRQSPPKRIGNHDVVAVRDYLERRRVTSAGEVSTLDLPKTDALIFELDGGSRIVARPSGTEPKVKFYFDVREPIRAEESLEVAESRALGTAKDLADAFVGLAL